MAGRKMIVITETGDVYPCEILNKQMGTLRENDYNIKEVLKSESTKRIIKWIRKNKCFCTFECAIQNSLIYNPAVYPLIMKKFFKIK